MPEEKPPQFFEPDDITAVGDAITSWSLTPSTGDALLGQGEYDFSYRRFPADLGSDGTHHQHYMVININVRDSVFGKQGDGGAGTSAYGDYIKRGNQQIKTFTVKPSEMSKIDVLRFELDRQYTSKSGTPLGFSGNDGVLGVVLPRFTRRIVESIAIFMPQSVVYSNQHEYTPLDLLTLGKEVAGGAADFTKGVYDGMRGKRGNVFNPSTLIDAIGKKFSSVSAMAQLPLNPITEVLYRTTPQRQFTFDFLLAPSNRAESIALDQIYKTLRFHAAPELTTNYVMPLYKSPSEFDITFYHKGNENTAIPRINTCVLEKIDMDFAPLGIYSTFSNGAPVSARMTLQFRELESITKLRTIEGF